MNPQKVFSALIDTCVMESYFRAHMAERNLLFLDSVAETILSRSFPIDPQTGVSALLSLKATSHPIHDRLLRLRHLHTLFECLCNGAHPLRIALSKLQLLDTVRIIRGGRYKK